MGWSNLVKIWIKNSTNKGQKMNPNVLVRAWHKEVVLIQDLKLKPSKIVKKIRNKRKPCKKIGDGYNSMFWA